MFFFLLLFFVFFCFFFFFFKQKTAYEMLRSLVGSEMCIRDRNSRYSSKRTCGSSQSIWICKGVSDCFKRWIHAALGYRCAGYGLSLIHISEPTRLLSISYAVFCLKKKKEKIATQ